MTLCRMCPTPLPRGRRVYCCDACCRAYKVAALREKYHADPDYARQRNAVSRAWYAEHREHAKQTLRLWRRRQKAARLARVLSASGLAAPRLPLRAERAAWEGEAT